MQSYFSVDETKVKVDVSKHTAMSADGAESADPFFEVNQGNVAFSAE